MMFFRYLIAIPLLLSAACAKITPMDHAVETVSSLHPLFSIGAIADCQYADQDDGKVRMYRMSTRKLLDAIEDLNTQDLEFVVHLGDFIDKDFDSFATLAPIASRLKPPWRHVLGNHDYAVHDAFKPIVHKQLGMPSRYYSFEKNDWVFIVTNGNDLSTYAWPKRSTEHAEGSRLYAQQYGDRPSWNGGIGPDQMRWIEGILTDADKAGKKVMLFSHFPIFPKNNHDLWNASQVMQNLVGHRSVKAWVNGHNHKGNYGQNAGIHFVTMQGMVDTVETAYSTIDFFDDRIEIQGVERQKSYRLELRD